MQVIGVDWAEVTAIATSLLALGLLGAFGAAVFAAQQVREARKTREAQMAAEFFRRWDDDALVEARRMVGRFKSAEQLRDAFVAYVAADAPEAYVLYRELDYFEQLAALERLGAFDLKLIELMLGTHTDRPLGDVEAGDRSRARIGRVPALRWSRGQAAPRDGPSGAFRSAPIVAARIVRRRLAPSPARHRRVLDDLGIGLGVVLCDARAPLEVGDERGAKLGVVGQSGIVGGQAHQHGEAEALS